MLNIIGSSNCLIIYLSTCLAYIATIYAICILNMP